MVPFGFSFSDFTGALGIINKLRKGLEEAGGAAEQYRIEKALFASLDITLGKIEASAEAQHDNDSDQDLMV